MGTTTTSTTTTLQTTQSLMQQVGTQLQNTLFDQQYNLGNFVTKVGILPFIPSATIQFAASGMKPNTRLYAFFGNVPVSAWCAPTLVGYTPSTVEGSQLASAYGTALYSDAEGNCRGIFRIPPNTFKSQEIQFKLIDVANLEQGEDAITTEADGVYYGSTLTVAAGQSLLNTRQTVVSSTEVTQQQIVSGVNVDVQTTTTYVDNPPATYAGGGGCGCGSVICTKLYQLGMMDEQTHAADEQYGEMLRRTDPAVYYGYLRWARYVVKMMDNMLFANVVNWVAGPWYTHMKYTMGATHKDSLVGRWMMKIGAPICRVFARPEHTINTALTRG